MKDKRTDKPKPDYTKFIRRPAPLKKPGEPVVSEKQSTAPAEYPTAEIVRIVLLKPGGERPEESGTFFEIVERTTVVSEAYGEAVTRSEQPLPAHEFDTDSDLIPDEAFDRILRDEDEDEIPSAREDTFSRPVEAALPVVEQLPPLPFLAAAILLILALSF